MSTKRTMYRGTVEYLSGTVTAQLTITDADSVEVSLDGRTTWVAGEWVGAAGVTRGWRVLVGDTIPLPDRGIQTVYVRITDNPEIPVLNAGTLQII